MVGLPWRTFTMGREGEITPLPEDLVNPLKDQSPNDDSVNNGNSNLAGRLRSRVATGLTELKKGLVGKPLTEPFLPSLDSRPLSKNEYANQKDVETSNSGIETLATKAVNFFGSHKRIITTVGAITIAVGVPAGIFLPKVFASEDKPTPTEETIGSVSGGTSIDKYNQQVVPTEQQKPGGEALFDNTEKKWIKIRRIPQEEIDRMFPDAFGKLGDESTKTIITLEQPNRTLSPRQYEVDDKTKNTIQFQSFIDLRDSDDPSVQLEVEKSYNGQIAADFERFKDQEYYDTFIFRNPDGKIPKGTRIKMPLEGFGTYRNYRSSRTSETGGDFFIDFQNPQNGNIYKIQIWGTGENEDVFKLLLLMPERMPQLVSKCNYMAIGSCGSLLKRGQLVLEANTDLHEIGLKVVLAVKGEIGEPLQLQQNPRVITNAELISLNGEILASE